MKQLMIFFLITTIFGNEISMPLSKTESDGAFHFTEETVQDGWSADGQMYYENGKYVTGPREIDGFNYYFDEKTGKMVHGWKTVKENGVEKKYWYGQETGHMLYGDQRINGVWYHFDEETGELVEEKESGNIGWSDDGTKYYVGNSYITGEYEIDGQYYYFDPATGVMYKDQWRQAGSSKMYYGSDGVRVTGEQTIDGENYYFLSETGLMKKGWRKKDGSYVYYNSEGCMVYGEQTIKGNNYYFISGTGLMKKGWRKKDGTYVYYNSKGCMIYGEQVIRDNTYYFDDTTGLMVKGWRETDAGKYYYNSKGCMLYGKQTIDGQVYTFDETTGVLLEVKEPGEEGWSADGKMYFIGQDFVTGEHKIDGKYYYFDLKTGVMFRNRWRKVDGSHVYYGSDGARVTGEQTIRGNNYYFLPDTGLMKKGWRKKDGTYVYYNSKGVMVFGEQTINGKNYYFLSGTGLMKKGWRKKDGTYVYYNSKGCMIYGEQTINGKNYYFDENTGLMKKGWRKIDTTYVYYNTKGVMVYGDQTINGKNYYFRLENGRMYKGWRTVSGKKKYYDENGVLTKGQKQINGNWYYFDQNGIMAVGRTSIPASDNSGSAKVVVTDAKGKYVLRSSKVGLAYYTISSKTDAVNIGRVEHETKIYMEGIDVSEWNGNFDFSSYKNQFVIIRASWGQTHKDKKVDQFVDECERLGIPYGFYTYSYAENKAEAKEEAEFCMSIINDLKKKHGGKLKNFCMGVWFDMEDADHWKARRGFSFTNANIGGLCYTFCSEVSKKGYYTGIYMSASWLKYLSGTSANQYDKWVAHWGTSNNGEMQTDMSSYGTMQQYTSTNGKLDKDVIFVDKSHYKNK